jgi:hypothetical protein
MFFHQNEEAFFNFFITIFFVLSFFFTNTLIISSFFFKVDFIFICFFVLFLFSILFVFICFIFNYWFNYIMINNFSVVNTINFYFWFLVKLFICFYRQLFYMFDNHIILLNMFTKCTSLLTTAPFVYIVNVLKSMHISYIYTLFINYFSVKNSFNISLVKYF